MNLDIMRKIAVFDVVRAIGLKLCDRGIGRDSHWVEDCYATYDDDGDYIYD